MKGSITVVLHQPYALGWPLVNAASPIAIALGTNIQKRHISSTTKTSDPTKILAQQRLNRPVSPHLSIYEPQITWCGSIANRITGLVLSGSLYLWATSYLASPLLGWHLDSASMAAAFSALPIIAKVALKGTVAFPFTYHSLNGLRHLMWDTGYGFTNEQVAKTGWMVVGLSGACALLLAFMY
ncbi:succinate dehydrogenase cytochrome [Aspergillus sclerotialis]|uniref:Succinate dehydrogenase cytochrome n=1 Tax=Aspergillus sclerotialis TaxID=2070753 RepID=A0A3A2ZZ10_9EURO|nr:succinate dehydrogenase cytochrome [Aspergillus sclerotialis]